MTAASKSTRSSRTNAIYTAISVIGVGAFLAPFFTAASAAPDAAHRNDAPLVAAVVGGLMVAAIALELSRQRFNATTVAVLGMLSAAAGLLRLLDLPGGGSGIFFLVVLGGAAYHPRFGFLLGFTSMALSALVTSGLGPWLPFQMLALAWMGAGAGVVGRITRGSSTRRQLASLATYAWVWGFLYGAIMNLWFWPYRVRQGPLSWEPGLGVAGTLSRYWHFYAVTSLAWDAAGALANAILVITTGGAVLRLLRRVEHRLDPPVLLVARP